MLVPRSQSYVDLIFSPTTKRYAILSEEEKKKINEFIYKIDPRALRQLGKKQNMKALMLKAA